MAPSRPDRPGTSETAEATLAPSGPRDETSTLVEHSVDGIVVLDTGGTICFVNPAACRILRRREDELLGTEFSIPMVANEAVEVDIPSADGPTSIVELRMSSIDFRGGEAVFVGLRDITDLKHTQQEALRAQREAEAASRDKTELLYRVSHELRTPLGIIAGFAEFLQLDQDALTPEQARYVAQIVDASQHVGKLVDDLLDVGPPTEPRPDVCHEIVDLGSAARQVAELLAGLAESKSIDLQVAAVQAPAVVWADQQRVRQVLLNVVSNAIKYNAHGGRVRLAVECTATGFGRVAVEDTGRGLSPREQGMVFGAFERLDQGASEEKGTGLGLAVAKELTESMGGKIGVESAVRQGSTFWVEIPLIDAQPSSGGDDGGPG